VVISPKADRHNHPQWGLSLCLALGDAVIAQVQPFHRFATIDSPLISRRNTYQKAHFRVVPVKGAYGMIEAG
jgi:hypothetical protein